MSRTFTIVQKKINPLSVLSILCGKVSNILLFVPKNRILYKNDIDLYKNDIKTSKLR